MLGTYCTRVKRFEMGQFFRCHCVQCVHNTAHLGDDRLYCRYLEYRLSGAGSFSLPDSRPSIQIPPDLR